MKIGIENLASYLPTNRKVNDPTKWGMDKTFLDGSIGIERIAQLGAGESALSMCKTAFDRLQAKVKDSLQDCGLVVVITQNADTNMPHTSAVLQGLLELPKHCVCFDVSLGCTGFVHGLSIVRAFMRESGIKKALLFNVEVMSKIVDPDDKNTAMIFGDGATATLLTQNAAMDFDGFSYGTDGKKSDALKCTDNVLSMDGQTVYEFVARNVPTSIKKLLSEQNLSFDQIDRFIFHQGSKRTVEKLIQTLQLKPEQAPFDIKDYGNIGACSVPIILEKVFEKKDVNKILLSGFGVGLAWTNAILTRRLG